MKKLLLLALLVIVALPRTAAAQDGSDCDPMALKSWLTNRQTWRNASQDVLDADGMSIQNARTYLYEHMTAIEDLERPDCVNDAMLWTYYLYHSFQYLLTCAQNNDSACVAVAQERLDGYRERDAQTVNDLGQSIGFTVDALSDSRPIGWTLNFTPTPLPPTNTPWPAYSIPATQPPASNWNCSGNIYDCKNFSSCAEARSYFLACPGDPSHLDEDDDGKPCESLCSR